MFERRLLTRFIMVSERAIQISLTSSTRDASSRLISLSY